MAAELVVAVAAAVVPDEALIVQCSLLLLEILLLSLIATKVDVRV